MNQKTPMSVIALCAFLFGAGCGSTAELASPWSAAPATIDGSAAEWSGSLTPLKDAPVSLGVRNDADFLYLCLTTSEEQFRGRMLFPGFTVWFESIDGARLGVQYPVGVMNRDRGAFMREEGAAPESRDELIERALSELEILGNDRDDRTVFSTLQTPGVLVKIGRSDGSVVYEMKVPLARSKERPYAIGAAPGAQVRFSFESNAMTAGRSERGMGEHGSGMRPGGGMRPGSGGMPGGEMPGEGMSTERPARRQGMGPMSPLEYKAVLRLASGDAPRK